MQSVSFLSYLFHEMQQYGPFLVVVPLSTITAWDTQFATWAPDINVITYIGNAKARETIRKYEFGPTPKKLKINVLLTTYELVLKDVKQLGEIKWQALVVDEVSLWSCLFSLPSPAGPGTSSKKLGQPPIRSASRILRCFEAVDYRNTTSKQCERYCCTLSCSAFN